MREAECTCIVKSHKRGGDVEQVYQFYMYILFAELVIVTSIAIFLFVALVVIIRKMDNKKYPSAS